MNTARLLALEALSRVDEDNAYSNIVFDNLLKDHSLPDREVSLACAIFYGVLERKIQLDYIIAHYSKLPIKKLSPTALQILRMGAYQLLFMDKIPERAAVNESVKLAKQKKLFSAAGFINAVLRSIIRAKDNLPQPNEENRLEFLSVKYSCPEWLISLWQGAYGQTCAENLLRSLFGRPPLVARVNSLKATPQELIAQLASEDIAAAECALPGAIEITSAANVFASKAFSAGMFHIEDTSSQICCGVLSPQPGHTVIDVCAAPGGKSCTLAQMMKNTGALYAFDNYPQKIALMENSAKKLGISIIRCGLRDAATAKDDLPSADRVLCDVPCSGLGIIRKKPEIRYKDPQAFKELPEIQYKILCNSKQLTKPNGILVYSTCTLNPAENGEIAEKFLKEHPTYAPFEIPLPRGIKRCIDEPENHLTLMPHVNNTDGFFIAAFRRVR